MAKVLSRFSQYLHSNKFFRLVLLVFIFEAVWIALSAAYPQAFDENYHFGLIQVYSHHWLPFLSHQPAHADVYGAVARDPSYLYHYLMSFPYRIIELITKQQVAQVIILRFINISVFVAALILLRKVLLKAGASKALANLILMLFVLIPIVPQLAAQINYDNLLLPLTAGIILLGFRLMEEVRAKQASIWTIAMLIGACLLTSLVKYAFLPIFVGMAFFLLVVAYRANKEHLSGLFKQLAASWRAQRLLAKTVLIVALLIPLGMFIQRDGVNLISYHAIEPDCAKVLTINQCKSYSPWAYNYDLHQKLAKTGPVRPFTSPLVYPFQWAYWMWYRLFFAVNGAGSSFANYPPLPLPSAATLILLVAGVLALVKWWRKIFSNNLYLVMLFVITACYIAALIGQGYFTYRYTDILENMNGRYLLPVLALAAVIFGLAISQSLRRAQSRKVIIALVALLLFLEGGGLLTFIARSDDSWYVQNKTIVKVNDAAQKVIKPVLVNGKKSYSTSIWLFN